MSFITDMGEKLKLVDQKTGNIIELPQHAYWDDLGKGKPEVKETGDNLEHLKKKYNVPDNRIIRAKELTQSMKEAVSSENINIIVDRESELGYRVVNAVYIRGGFEKGIEKIKKLSSYKGVVQFVNPETGETVKGPKYDTATQIMKGRKISDVLPRGIKQQPPTEPTQYEPRDRVDELEWGKKPQQYKSQIIVSKKWLGKYKVTAYDENGNIAGNGTEQYEFASPDHVVVTVRYLQKKHPEWSVIDLTKEIFMNEITKFRNIIRECISEIKKENDPRTLLKESLRNVVKEVLKEIATVSKPEPTEEEKTDTSKGYFKKLNQRVDKTNDKLQAELETIVHGIDPTWEVYWDDHNQLIVRAHNLLYVRIVPKFENNYDIDAMVKLVDRVRAIAQTWDQVKAFVKANFNDLKNQTIPDKLHKKSVDNYEDREVIKKDAGPEKAKVNFRYQDPKHSSVKDTKKDDKNYNEPQTKRAEDMPDQPMKQVTEPGKDPESKNKNITKTPQVKPPKHKLDKKLRVKDKKTSKFTFKKTT
jgi:hypothetical protein